MGEKLLQSRFDTISWRSSVLARLPGRASTPEDQRMPIDDRIGGMTDKELENLNENAARLAKSGSPAQRAEADRLLPIIGEALQARGEAARTALAAKKEAQRAARPKAKPKTRKSAEAPA
jgi:hypothetical protein